MNATSHHYVCVRERGECSSLQEEVGAVLGFSSQREKSLVRVPGEQSNSLSDVMCFRLTACNTHCN